MLQNIEYKLYIINNFLIVQRLQLNNLTETVLNSFYMMGYKLPKNATWHKLIEDAMR